MLQSKLRERPQPTPRPSEVIFVNTLDKKVEGSFDWAVNFLKILSKNQNLDSLIKSTLAFD